MYGLLSLLAFSVPPLPVDARLDQVRAHLVEIAGGVVADGLPADPIVSKVREGLAKNIAASRIEAAVLRLAQDVRAVGRFLAGRKRAATPDLVRALVEGRSVGLALQVVEPLVAVGRPDATTARSVEVVTDLALRGYPGNRAVPVVASVLASDPGALGRVVATLETIRSEQALTQIEAIDALARGVAGARSLNDAYLRASDEERRRGMGASGAVGRDRASAGDAPGRSELAPGHLPRVNVSPGRRR